MYIAKKIIATDATLQRSHPTRRFRPLKKSAMANPKYVSRQMNDVPALCERA
jgi:hypothetical protein